jgi:outer membrane immunogenic protein
MYISTIRYDFYGRLSVKCLFSACLAALAICPTVTQAADLNARRQVVSASVISPATNWTGIYGGLHLGGVFGNSVALNRSGFDFGLNNGAGVLAGGQMGADYQIDRIVAGLAFDLSYSSASQTSGAAGSPLVSINGAAPVAVAISSLNTYSLLWEGSLRGRLGYTISPDLLLYVTGGLAFGGDRTAVQITALGTTGTGSIDRTRLGWTVGGGAEYVFAPNWSLFAEYRYTDLGLADGRWSLSNGTTVWLNDPLRSTNHAVRVGVNYRFSTGPGAVVAKY